MKDSKFIELLNLYVDHQISAEEAALLEAEIQQKPERRKIYREYCQMQKACATLSENFRTQAPAIGGKVVEFPQARSRMKAATYTMGMLAAAACVALVVVNRQRFESTPAATAVVSTSAPVEQTVAQQVTEPAPVSTALPVRAALQPVFAGLVQDGAPVETSLVSSSRVPLDWMNRVNLQPVPAEALWFETRPTLHPENMMLRSSQGTYQEQTVAWRFQR